MKAKGCKNPVFFFFKHSMAGLIEHGVSGATPRALNLLVFIGICYGGGLGHKVEARVNGSAGLR